MSEMNSAQILEPAEFATKFEEKACKCNDVAKLYEREIFIIFDGIATKTPFSAVSCGKIRDTIVQNLSLKFVTYSTTYLEKQDFTIVTEDTKETPLGNYISTKVIGEYYGKPNEMDTEMCVAEYIEKEKTND